MLNTLGATKREHSRMFPFCSPTMNNTKKIPENGFKHLDGCTPPRHDRLQFTVRALLIAMFVVALLCGLTQWHAMRSSTAKKLKDTRVAFKMTGDSLEVYDSIFGHLPYPVRYETPGKITELGMANGTGKPLYSWRAEVAEFADSWWCARSWDESKPWDATENRTIASFPWRYSYDAIGLDSNDQLPTKFSPETNMMAITGPGTAFGCKERAPASLSELDSDTILVVEVWNSGVHWMESGDLDIRNIPRTINAPDGKGISSRYECGVHVLFADGEVWYLSKNMPFEILERFFTIDGAKAADRKTLLQPYIVK